MLPIQVTEPFLPDIKEYQALLAGIWERNWLTNQGPLVCELEKNLRIYLQVSSPVHCVANGGLGLQIILKALGVSGEVITTPFSYVATTSAPLWEGCSVIFADIDPLSLTIDPKAVEAAITRRTQAILATHVFGNPCDVEALAAIADKHGLALIYDAAHAFGVRYKGKSILEYGDASLVSTHATKLFHTVEGGFVVAKDTEVSEKVEWMRRFGHAGPEQFKGIGMNAKMSELHAAMGLSVMNHLPEILSGRRRVVEHYQSILDEKEGVSSAITLRDHCEWNYAYFPVVFDSEELLLRVMDRLKKNEIYARRYFYPSLDSLDFVGAPKNCPQSLSVSTRIACLPLNPNLKEEAIEKIVSCI